MRVLPLENEAINECWLSDKDRFSYEGLNSDDRLTRPMVKRDGEWHEVDWPRRSSTSHAGCKDIVAQARRRGDRRASAPHSTLEELYLAAAAGARHWAATTSTSACARRDFRADGAAGAPGSA